MNKNSIVDEWIKLCSLNQASSFNLFHSFDSSDIKFDWKQIRQFGNFFDKNRYWGKYYLDWFSFTTHCVFPFLLYKKYNKDIQKLMKDPSILVKNQKLGGKNITFNYFGRLVDWYDYRNNTSNSFNQINYLIKRMTYVPDYLKKPIRGLQAFTFYTTSPAWLYEILDVKLNVPRSGRTNWACMFLVSFNYDDSAGRLHLTAVFRNLYASHSFGDMAGLTLMLKAICKEIGIKPGLINIHALHWEFDSKKIINKLL